MRFIHWSAFGPESQFKEMDDDGHHYRHLSTLRKKKNKGVAQAQGDRQFPLVPVERDRIAAGYIERPIALLSLGVTANVAGAATGSPTGPRQGLNGFLLPNSL
jgi:hypothetical protein